MTQIKTIISILIYLGAAFAAGRYFAPTKTITVEKDVVREVIKVEHQTTIITKTPDGKTVTTIVKDTNTQTDEKSKTNSKEEIGKKDSVHISLLVGTAVSFPLAVSPIYGISISKNFIGPLSLGVFGMTNKTVGISIGVEL